MTLGQGSSQEVAPESSTGWNCRVDDQKLVGWRRTAEERTWARPEAVPLPQPQPRTHPGGHGGVIVGKVLGQWVDAWARPESVPLDRPHRPQVVRVSTSTTTTPATTSTKSSAMIVWN